MPFAILGIHLVCAFGALDKLGLLFRIAIDAVEDDVDDGTIYHCHDYRILPTILVFIAFFIVPTVLIGAFCNRLALKRFSGKFEKLGYGKRGTRNRIGVAVFVVL